MSNLGDQLQDEIDEILALQTAEEKGTEEGDEWDAEYEGYVTEVQSVFNDAAPDTIRNSNGEITADVNNTSTATEELSANFGNATDSLVGVESFRDTDTTTPFEFNPTALPSHDVFELKAIVANRSGTGLAQSLRLNGDGSGTANYNYSEFGSATTGASEFPVLNIAGAEVVPIEVTILSETVEGSVPTAGVFIAAGDFDGGFVDGRYDPGGPIDAIELFSDGEATGAAALYGYNYPR